MELKPRVTGGAAAMLRRVLELNEPRDVDFPAMLERMLGLYEIHLVRQTALFEGAAEVLEHLEAQGVPWGIVTNKIARFTDPLLAALHLDRRAACVISGDTVAEKKPHPLPLLEACRRTGVQPGSSVYIGDARRDIEAGRSAGMHTLAAAYGYVDAEDPAHTWEADGILGHLNQLLPWLERP
jgi:phosphoglycolate phosphatase